MSFYEQLGPHGTGAPQSSSRLSAAMETTGDMSAITRAGPLNAELFAGVRGGTNLDLR